MAKAYPTPKSGQAIAQEDGGKGQAGLYRHPETGAEAICQYDPLFGNTQANAFERLGFEWVREAEPEEIKTVPGLNIDANNLDKATLRGIAARQDDLAEQNDLLRKQLADQAEQRAQAPKDATDVSGEHARQSAAEQVESRTQTDGVVETLQAPSAPEKTSRKSNKSTKKVNK